MIDRWFFEMLPVKVWFEEQGMRFSLLDAPMQLAVQSKVKLLTAVLARSFYVDREVLITLAPLHERRGYRIFRSSRKHILPSSEAQSVRSLFAGHWKCPAHFSSPAGRGFGRQKLPYQKQED